MNKKSASYFLIILCFFFIGINQVCAKENCISVKLELEKYETYTKMLNTIDCSDTGSESNVAICNEYNVRKNLVITELMKKNDEKKICSNEKKQVNKIIKENEDNCGQIFSEEFNDMVNSVLVIFYIAGPILLILFGSLDFAKATVSAEQDALKKASVNFAKRIAATVLLFMTPTIVNIIISFNVSDKYLSGNAYTCNYKYLVYNKKYKITYVPKNNSSTKPISSNKIKRCTGPSCPSYIWPLGSKNIYITDPFGNRVSPTTGASSHHKGIDIGANSNDNLYAIADGIIVDAGYNESAGNYVELQSVELNGMTLIITYMHNNQITVSIGDKVNQGDVIALAGSTGCSTGTHSHFQIKDANTSIYYNPILFLYNGTTNVKAIDSSTNKIVSVDLIKSYSSADDWIVNYSYDGSYSKAK